MKTNIVVNLRRKMSQTLILSGVAAMAFVLVSFVGVQYAHAAITTQLEIGSKGSQVTELQTYLAANASIYPSGLITGYFGELTKAAVERFQTAQSIVSSGTPATTGYGRVGPQTMARLNVLMNSGVSQAPWDTVPVLTNPSVLQSSTAVTFNWSTNEPTHGQIYWNSVPLQVNEASGPRQQPYVSGNLALDAGGLQTNHSVSIQNLQANTLYYYTIRGVDAVGNMSMIWPTTFRTNP